MAFHGTNGWEDPAARNSWTIVGVDFENPAETFEILVAKKHDGHERYLYVEMPGRKLVIERDGIEDLKLFLAD